MTIFVAESFGSIFTITFYYVNIKFLYKKIVTHILANSSKGCLRELNLLHEHANGKRNI